MRSLNVGNEERSVYCRETLFPLQRHEKMDRTLMREKTCRYGWLLVFLIFFSGCFHVPMSSETEIHDPLQAPQPMTQGEVLLVFGENAPVPKASLMVDYFTANCKALTQEDTIGELIKTILRVNPQPGRFAVRHLKDQETETNPDCTATDGKSILCRLNLTKARVLADRLRYAIHVKENFEAEVHVPAYVPPFGVASCSNRTVLEVTVWELPTENCVGSFSVSAEGEYTVMAYMLHIIVSRDTQKDATERLAREIVEKLTGLKPIEDRAD